MLILPLLTICYVNKWSLLCKQMKRLVTPNKHSEEIKNRYRYRYRNRRVIHSPLIPLLPTLCVRKFPMKTFSFSLTGHPNMTRLTIPHPDWLTSGGPHSSPTPWLTGVVWTRHQSHTLLYIVIWRHKKLTCFLQQYKSKVIVSNFNKQLLCQKIFVLKMYREGFLN